MAEKKKPHPHRRSSDPDRTEIDTGGEDESYPSGLHKALTHLKRGALHHALGVPVGQKIPAEKLRKAKTSKNAHIRHMAAFAHVLEGFDKK